MLITCERNIYTMPMRATVDKERHQLSEDGNAVKSEKEKSLLRPAHPACDVLHPFSEQSGVEDSTDAKHDQLRHRDRS